MSRKPRRRQRAEDSVRGPRRGFQRWIRKFGCAFRGIFLGTRGQDSFVVHLPVTAAVVALAAWLRLPATDWCLLILAIGLVLTAELVNSALEHLVRAVHPDRHTLIGEALDIASAAVLIATVAAVIVGLVVLAPPLCQRLIAGAA